MSHRALFGDFFEECTQSVFGASRCVFIERLTASYHEGYNGASEVFVCDQRHDHREERNIVEREISLADFFKRVDENLCDAKRRPCKPSNIKIGNKAEQKKPEYDQGQPEFRFKKVRI